MSTTIQYGYEQSLGLTPPIPSEVWSLPTEEYHFPVSKLTPEKIRQMYPDWDTKKPIPFEELFGYLRLPPEEAEAYIQAVAESREESRRLAAEQEERERRDK